MLAYSYYGNDSRTLTPSHSKLCKASSRRRRRGYNVSTLRGVNCAIATRDFPRAAAAPRPSSSPSSSSSSLQASSPFVVRDIPARFMALSLSRPFALSPSVSASGNLWRRMGLTNLEIKWAHAGRRDPASASDFLRRS